MADTHFQRDRTVIVIVIAAMVISGMLQLVLSQLSNHRLENKVECLFAEMDVHRVGSSSLDRKMAEKQGIDFQFPTGSGDPSRLKAADARFREACAEFLP